MIKRILLYMMFTLATLILTGCGTSQPEQASPVSSQKLQAAVSFNAMKELAQAIGGDKVDIHMIIPDGMEPHDFEPKTSDLTALHQSRVFIMNGLGMEQAWAEKALLAAGNENIIVVTASDGADVITSASAGFLKQKSAPPQTDPHLWLSLKGAKAESRRICDAFIKADPHNSSYYEENYRCFAGQLDALYLEYQEKFRACPQKIFITGHAAFSYTARDFGLTQNSLENVFASGEPSARRLKELADYSRAHHIKVIFIEDMESPLISETLAREAGADVAEISTLESGTAGKNYLDTMHENLEKIYQSLL